MEVIRRETLARGRKALVIYGDQHFMRGNAGGIVARLENGGAKVFAVHSETGVECGCGGWEWSRRSPVLPCRRSSG